MWPARNASEDPRAESIAFQGAPGPPGLMFIAGMEPSHVHRKVAKVQNHPMS